MQITININFFILKCDYRLFFFSEVFLLILIQCKKIEKKGKVQNDDYKRFRLKRKNNN